MRLCSFEDCNKKHESKGWCAGHNRQVRTGKELTPLRPKRSKDVDPVGWFWSRVDKSGECWIWQGGGTKGGYGQYHVGDRDRYVHRYAYELLVEPIPEGLFIDHICHVRNCVNPEHLRPATNKQNMENLSGLTSHNTSGYRGVLFNKKEGKWQAKAQHNGRDFHGGFHTTIEKANEAAIELRGRLFSRSDGR